MTDPFTLLPLEYFTTGGKIVLTALLATSFALAVSGAINLCSPKPHFQKSSGWLHGMTAGLYVAGFLLICWFHYCINRHLPLEL
ncbi:MAG: hypothetical protein KKE17_04565, partial [Proteobacteria bacterium]|nr:hypothetical protein [Pseudomonadota bacterium]MBU1709260.1 hypothetical protein [Pseudomonadota bacterium]